MKKTSIIFIICFVVIISAKSQISIPIGTQEQINNFFYTKTYIVLKNNFVSDYNFTMKEIIPEEWKITKYEFIKESDFEKYRKDPTKSFLMINKVQLNDDKTETLFDFLVLSLGGNYKTVDEMPTLCAIPLCYSEIKTDNEDYTYKLGILIKFIQNNIEICKNNPTLKPENILDYYKKNASPIQDKIMYIIKDELSPELRNDAAFKRNFSQNYKFSNQDEIEKLIKNQDDKAIIIHQVTQYNKKGLSYSITFLIDTKNANIFSYNFRKIDKENDKYLQITDLYKN
ncbi:MAG: hypothetical protein LBV69_09785 [Bacteroidales bacterium]|jgi:hypothetical protein|nr:hypothetical protein [Bacteroidales bacterium]